MFFFGVVVLVEASKVNTSQFAHSPVEVVEISSRGATSQRQAVESSGK